MDKNLFLSLVLFGIAIAANVLVCKCRVGSSIKFIGEKIIGNGCIFGAVLFFINFLYVSFFA